MTSAFLDRLAVLTSTACGIGKAPVAPGTFGSLPGVALGGLLALWRESFASRPVGYLVAAFVLLAAIGFAYWAIARTEKLWGTHDDQRVVVDEVVGQMIALAFVAPTPWALVLGFLLFRLLDVTKPLAIGWIDEKGPGAVGTLFDDVLAGAVAAVPLCLIF